jgi:hydroxymethylglutaryl-CoA lyase
MVDLPKTVSIAEEGPREGFQIERGPISTEQKIELIDALSETGLQQIQIVSFVPAANVPGMADADSVVAGYRRKPGVRYTGLWLNERGLERAIATERLDIAGTIGTSASAAFLLRNQKRTPSENLDGQRSILEMYRRLEIPAERAGIMAAFGSNFAEDITPSNIANIAGELIEVGVEKGVSIRELVLADTMGWATPDAVERVVGAVRTRFPDLEIILHLHDTRGMAIANAWAGLGMGVRRFDAAVGGLGGCPYAANNGAAGNICTEDLVFLCHEAGIETGIDLDLLIEAALLAERIVGHPLRGAVKMGGSRRAVARRMGL